METILYLTHVETDGSLSKPSLEALEAARSLASSLEGSRLVAGIWGEAVQPAADAIAACGAAKFLAVEGSEFAAPRYASDAAAAEALCRKAEAGIVVAPGTSRSSRVMAGVAHRLEGRADTHAARVQAAGGAVQVNRWYYRQRIEATIQREQRPWMVVLDPGCGAAFSGESGTAEVEKVSVELPEASRRTQFTGTESPPADEQTIRPDADLLFVAGAGWTKKQKDGATHIKDAERLILGFLKKSHASLGSSKSLVDLSGEGQEVLSFMTHLNQVGQTGATPRHPKGLSACCHGEEPHVVGWRFINERRAVNLDPSCGWARGKADVLYVADAFEVMEKVNEMLPDA